MPLIDVIIPAYNAAKYLPFALNSVARQTESYWRIVLVDDGSTDNIEAVVEPLGLALGSRLRFVRQENRGLSAARNRAIRSSDSRFIAILDADDGWTPERLECGLRAISSSDRIGLVHSRVAYINQAGQVNGESPGSPAFASGSIARQIYMRQVHLLCPSVLFRRTCLEAVGDFDETMTATEDRDLWFRIATQYEVAFIDSVLAYYRRAAGSMSTDTDRMLKNQLRFISKNYGQAGCGPKERRTAIASAYRDRGWVLRERGCWSMAAVSFAKACFHQPGELRHLRAFGRTLLSALRLPSS